MSNTATVLAFDFGASSGRAIRAVYDGQNLTYEEIHRFENVPIEKGGHLFWDVETLLKEIHTAIQKAGTFDSLGFDTWGVDFGLLDTDGHLLANPVHYRDARTNGKPEQAAACMPAEELYAHTGNQIMAINTLFQLLALQEQEPELLQKAEQILFMPDLFAALLGAEPVCERSIASTSQIWYWKEVFELVALVGFLLMLAPLALLLMKLPFLSNAKQAVAAPTPAVGTLSGKLGTISLFVVGMLIPAIIFPAVYDGSLTAEPIRWMRYASDIALLLSVVGIVLAARSTEDDRKTWLSGSVCVLIASIVLRVLVTKNIFETNATWQGPTVNSIVTWALICACISIVTMVCVYLFGGRKQKGITLEQYGIAAKPVSVAAAFCVALLVCVIAYACLFAVDAIFKTDFRIWTFAFKTFEASAIPAAVKYMPFFFVYYFVSGAAAISNTSSEKLQGGWGYLLAALTNMGGILLWLVLQYGTLFRTGVAFYPGQALGGILLFALVPSLAIASCLAKYLYKKTGSVYVAAFLNTILMTMMTVANTAIYFQA